MVQLILYKNQCVAILTRMTLSPPLPPPRRQEGGRGGSRTSSSPPCSSSSPSTSPSSTTWASPSPLIPSPTHPIPSRKSPIASQSPNAARSTTGTARSTPSGSRSRSSMMGTGCCSPSSSTSGGSGPTIPASNPARVPSSQRRRCGRRDCLRRRSGEFRPCSGATRTTSSTAERNAQSALRTSSWAMPLESWSACIATTSTASTSGSPYAPPVPAAGPPTNTDTPPTPAHLIILPFFNNNPEIKTNHTKESLCLLRAKGDTFGSWWVAWQQNLHRNYKNNNMLDLSDKQNLLPERSDPRLVTFHFCEKYTKKCERRLRTEADCQPRMIRGSKITLVAKGKPLGEQRRNQQRQQRKLSNFEILKRKVSYLENQQFLGDRSQRHWAVECNPEVDYIVTGEFAQSKRITVLEKYRQNIKNLRKDHEKRKASLNLIVRAQALDASSKPFNPQQQQPQPPPLAQRDGVEHSEWQMRKREIVSQCAKRYFRPQSLSRSRQLTRFGQNVAQVKGRRMEQSARTLQANSRIHRSTINL